MTAGHLTLGGGSMSVEKTSHLCVELICCDVKLGSCERSHILPELLHVYRTEIPHCP
ncbi:hypothetical protein [Thiolapillus sp.]|uniref:hypothetical protein n=1 Tax=Thiolapillus sp. TaxID=2017437 RepID=UPI003AF48AB2